MSSAYLGLFWGFFGISLLCIARYGYIAATASDGLRKGQARLIAGLAFCSWFIVLPILWSVYEKHLQVFEFGGTIASVDIKNHQSSHYSANLIITTELGGTIVVHVSDASKFWRTGQRLRVRYYEGSGELVGAAFLDSAGKDEEDINASSLLARVFSIVIGSLAAFGMWLQYRRDPEARLENTREPSGLSNAVDKDSLLHLSDERGD